MIKKVIIIILLIIICLQSYLFFRGIKEPFTKQITITPTLPNNPEGKKVVFLHIPKNAGSTINKIYNLNKKTPAFHSEAYPKKDEINFAIIRNPETRLQSIFAHIKDRTNIRTSSDLIYFHSLPVIFSNAILYLGPVSNLG